MMPKYGLLKHYLVAPALIQDVPMYQWMPNEFSAHVQYMRCAGDCHQAAGASVVELPLPVAAGSCRTRQPVRHRRDFGARTVLGNRGSYLRPTNLLLRSGISSCFIVKRIT
jgi:hypothetical protein